MTVTDLINPNTIKQELVVFLRNSDIFSTSDRGVSTTTDEFSGDDNETEFTLTNTNCKNIRSITVDDVAQSLGTDYTVDYSTAVVTFTTAPADGWPVVAFAKGDSWEDDVIDSSVTTESVKDGAVTDVKITSLSSSKLDILS